MENEDTAIDIAVIRPLVHQHVTMLTSAGKSVDQAIAIAADVVAVIYYRQATVRRAPSRRRQEGHVGIDRANDQRVGR